MLSRTFTLGRYTCVERIGVTPAGEQWRAKRFGLIGVERQYLLIKLHPQLAKDAAAVARLTTALKTYGELDHEGLLRFFEQGSQGSDYYAVFDFVGYADLRKLKAGLELLSSREKASALLPAIVVALGQELTTALARAHERGLYHGLLSPQSVLLDAQGRVHIADVGLSPTLPAASWASDQSLKAAYPYMAPELQISGAPTAQSDVYSLGTILQELLGGLSIATATAEAAPVLGELMPVLMQATARVASGRFATIAALQQALQAVRLPMPEAVRSALQQVGQQFQMAGDTVPQPVVISERSSAEPLPPPPTGRVIIGKPGASVPLRGRAATSKSGVGGDDALNLAPAGGRGVISRLDAGESLQGDEDTPLPMSRPLLATNPKINLDGDGAGAADTGSTRQSGSNEKLQRAITAAGRSGPQSVTGPSAKPPSRPELKATEARTAGQRPSSGTQAAVGAAGGAAERPADAVTGGRGSPSRGPASPVSINPKAQFGPGVGQPGKPGAGPAPRDSASTPTQDVVEAVAPAGGQGLSWTPEALALASDRNSGTGAFGHLVNPSDAEAAADKHSVETTNPGLVPARVGLPSTGVGSDEPTNQLSAAEARALAEAEGRSSPLAQVALQGSSPESATAGLPFGAPGGELGLPGFAGGASDVALAGGDGMAEGLSGRAPAGPAGGRRSLLLGLGMLGLLGGGLVTYLATRSGQGGGSATASLDGGAGRADARGVELASSPPVIAPGELRLTSEPAADVYLDKQPRGRTPLTLQLPPGPHKLLLIAQEYKLLRREVTAGSELSLKLERAKLPDDVAGPQVVKIKCKTKDELRILVDGNDTGLACPTEALTLSPGRHTFSFLQPATEELQDKQQKVKSGKGATKLKVKF